MTLDHEATPRTATRLALFATLGLLPLAAEVAAEWQNVGLSYVRARRFDNETMPPYGPQAGDQFAWSLATGDFDGDFYDDLAIGAPGEDEGALLDTGFVFVAYGQSTWALNCVHTQGFDQDGLLGAGNSESDDPFGWALASGDFDGDGHGDLAIGMPMADQPGAADVGAEVVLYGSLFADSFKGGGFSPWTDVAP